MTLDRCPLSIFCSRGTPPKVVWSYQQMSLCINNVLWSCDQRSLVVTNIASNRINKCLSLLEQRRLVLAGAGKVDVRLPSKGNSTSHGARPVHPIITMIKWIRTSRLSIKKSLHAGAGGGAGRGADAPGTTDLPTPYNLHPSPYTLHLTP